jgi:hypothetical protein
LHALSDVDTGDDSSIGTGTMSFHICIDTLNGLGSVCWMLDIGYSIHCARDQWIIEVLL